LPEGCPNPATDLLFPATAVVMEEDGTRTAALMFPSTVVPRWSKCIAAHAGEWVRGKAYCWLQERDDGGHGAGILLDITVGTERIFAGIGLLEVPALVDLFTRTGVARLYSDLMSPENERPVSPEDAALGVRSYGWQPADAPYMRLKLGEDARRRMRMFFEEIYPKDARP